MKANTSKTIIGSMFKWKIAKMKMNRVASQAASEL